MAKRKKQSLTCKGGTTGEKQPEDELEKHQTLSKHGEEGK